MPLFECGGSNILDNIAVNALAQDTRVFKAADQGYDGYAQVSVQHFATLGELYANTNGRYEATDGMHSYLTVNVDVPLSIDNNYAELFSGSASQDNPQTIDYIASNYILKGYKYVEVIATNSEWHRPSDGEIIPGGPTQTRRALVPLSSTETNWGAVGFYTQITSGGPSYAVVPFLVQPTRITLGSPVDPPVPSTDPDFVQHLWNVGTITKVRLIR